MTDQDDVRCIAEGLPDISRAGSGYRVGGKQFAWTYLERVDPKKPRAPRPDVLAVRVDGQGGKQTLLEAGR